MMRIVDVCNRDNLCVDCDNERCRRFGDIGADCPKWTCDNCPPYDCEHCQFIKDYIEEYRKSRKV